MTCRARLSPQDVGIPDVGRRRTPGLRREEVSALSGVCVSWYTWLEQGRDINVSEQVLNAISVALRLDSCEKTYLYNLVGLNPGSWRYGGVETDQRALSTLVDGWMPSPAFVSDRFLDVRAANRAATVVLGVAEGGHNCVMEMFMHKSVPQRYPERAEAARRVVARFRSHVARRFDDPEVRGMVEQLYHHSGEFAALWDQHEVLDETAGTETFWNPITGALVFDFRVLDFGNPSDLRLTVFTPHPGSDTESKIGQLMSAELSGPTGSPEGVQPREAVRT